MALHNKNFSSDDSNIPFSQVKMKRRRITQISSSEDFSTDTSSEIISIHRLSTHHNMILFSNEDEKDEFSINNTTISPTEWSDPIGNQPRLTPFIGTPGFKLLNRNYKKIEDIYSLLLSDKIFKIIVEEINRYAEKVLIEKASSRLEEWIPTNKNELKRFLGSSRGWE